MAKVVTGKVRLSYVNVFKPKGFEGQEAKYSVSVLVRKDDKKTLELIKNALSAVKEEDKGKWGGKIPANLRLPLRDGDTERPEDEAYKGCYFFNATSKRKPLVLDPEGSELFDEDEMYSGCYGRVSVNFYGYNANGNRGIAAGLNAVKKIADGEKLGGNTASASDFEDGFEDDDVF